MKSEDKKKSITRQQQTASIAPGLGNSGIDSPVAKDNGRPSKPGRAGGGKFLAVTAARFSLLAPEDILIDVNTDEDGMAFRFTWR